MAIKPTASLPFQAIARVGDRLEDVDTPALILDLDAFEDNLRGMQSLAELHGVALRPHGKAHKCPEIALRQVALGARGICCQKVTEAWPFLQAGITDILISNEVVGRQKLELLAHLASQARVTVCVDHPEALKALSAALDARHSFVDVLVEVDIGQKRCGVQSPEQAVALANQVASLPNVRFAGIQAYHGGIQHKRSFEDRQRAAAKGVKATVGYVDALRQAGFACEVVTGGGTGTAGFDAASGVFTEVQPGSYAFMDGDYGVMEWGEVMALRHALFLQGTVISTPTPERAVLDIGLKSTSAESGLPQVVGREGLRCTALNDEHCILIAEDPRKRPALGERLLLIPGHCDPTFNLHDELVVVRQGVVEGIWPVAARGLSR
ncbi:DSD1 family PLP-dependent enzyme [Achromobacter sp. F4_2707]|uniref:DSD1 family PLP-dependent enzyme n=1 Tax=Achromobacter sp. F4_2707 TaxID=3114286 RepID=UPI0039C6BEF9